VRTDRVVVFPSAFRHDLRFLECIEQFPVEKLRPHFPIERFDIAVFPWRARLDVERRHVEMLQPASESQTAVSPDGQLCKTLE
jgi:hypothetical protein